MILPRRLAWKTELLYCVDDTDFFYSRRVNVCFCRIVICTVVFLVLHRRICDQCKHFAVIYFTYSFTMVSQCQLALLTLSTEESSVELTYTVHSLSKCPHVTAI
jgi:hypothetical protein